MPQTHLSYDQTISCQAPRFTTSATNINVTAQEGDVAWTNIVSAIRKSTTGKFLLRFQISGTEAAATDITCMCRVTIDGVTTSYLGAYGNRISTVIANRAVVARGIARVTLSANVNHTFQLQAAYRTTPYAINSGTNPGLERGYLIVQPI